MKKITASVESLPRSLIFVICLLVAASIGMLDYFTGDLSLVLFYIIPIVLATWTLGRTSGLFISLLCGAELFTIDRYIASSKFPFVSIRTWNSLMEALFLIFTGYILTSFQIELMRKKKRAEQLEAANLELNAFNYSVAHDLRKPLTNINGYSQLIVELYGRKMDQKCRGYLMEIYEGTLRMNQLIDALLKFSSLAHSELSFETINLSEMAKSIISEMRLAEPDRKIDIQIAEGVKAIGDPKMLRIALENLIGNAWKYTGKKNDATISFGMTMSGRRTIYFVRDNGVGFDGSYGDKLFIPFQRLPGSEDFAGFGTGLATVQRIIKRQGGRIWAEGELGKGATFYFTLGDTMTIRPSYSGHQT